MGQAREQAYVALTRYRDNRWVFTIRIEDSVRTTVHCDECGPAADLAEALALVECYLLEVGDSEPFPLPVDALPLVWLGGTQR